MPPPTMSHISYYKSGVMLDGAYVWDWHLRVMTNTQIHDSYENLTKPKNKHVQPKN